MSTSTMVDAFETLAPAAKGKDFEIGHLLLDTPRKTLLVDLGKDVFDAIRVEYEKNPKEIENLAFHRREHTWHVVRNAQKILRCLVEQGLITIEEYEVGILAATYHDRKILSRFGKQIVALPEGKVSTFQRLRTPGDSEGASIARLHMDLIAKGLRDVFNHREMCLIAEAIVATGPGYDPMVDGDPEAATVIQPFLLWGPNASHFVVRTLAVADLATSGMNPDEFPWDGDALFREMNIDVEMHCLGLVARTDEEILDFEKLALRRSLQWDLTQGKFVRGRHLRRRVELEGFPKEVWDMFPDHNYELAMELANEKHNSREGMGFRDRMRGVGFEVRI